MRRRAVAGCTMRARALQGPWHGTRTPSPVTGMDSRAGSGPCAPRLSRRRGIGRPPRAASSDVGRPRRSTVGDGRDGIPPRPQGAWRPASSGVPYDRGAATERGGRRGAPPGLPDPRRRPATETRLPPPPAIARTRGPTARPREASSHAPNAPGFRKAPRRAASGASHRGGLCEGPRRRAGPRGRRIRPAVGLVRPREPGSGAPAGRTASGGSARGRGTGRGPGGESDGVGR